MLFGKDSFYRPLVLVRYDTIGVRTLRWIDVSISKRNCAISGAFLSIVQLCEFAGKVVIGEEDANSFAIGCEAVVRQGEELVQQLFGLFIG